MRTRPPSLTASSSLAAKIRRLARNSRLASAAPPTSLGNSYRRHDAATTCKTASGTDDDLRRLRFPACSKARGLRHVPRRRSGPCHRWLGPVEPRIHGPAPRVRGARLERVRHRRGNGAQDSEDCHSYGAATGTDAYFQCCMVKSQQRIDASERAHAQIQNGLDIIAANHAPLRPIQNILAAPTY
jgi:hypothetical protein